MSANDENVPQNAPPQPQGASYEKVVVKGSARAHLGDVKNTIFVQQYGQVPAADFHLAGLYYNSMNARRKAIVAAESMTCDWIWTTDFSTWIGDESAKLFWIAGKPGSGKSTLVKYLEQDRNLRSRLPARPQRWRIISFYFDFREDDRLGNNMEGLLRSLLTQLLRNRPDAAAALGMDHTTEIDYRQKLRDALDILSAPCLMFVDGLDEFTGDLRALVNFLCKLTEHPNFKLCLASRPEPSIRQVLHGYAQLEMSEYNSVGIQNYVQSALTLPSLEEVLEDPSLENIRKALHDRAHGVFLWVYLAIKEILDACDQGASQQEILNLIYELPTELKPFYERIQSKMPLRTRSEAALLFTLVLDAAHSVTLDQIHHALIFLKSTMNLNFLPSDIPVGDRLGIRIHAATGGLLEVLGSPILNNTQLNNGRVVRLLHETVRSYSRDSRWTHGLLPLELNPAYPTDLWTRLCSRALNMLDEPMLHGIDGLRPSQPFEDTLRVEKRIPWIRFSQHSAQYIFLYAERSCKWCNATTQQATQQAIRSSLVNKYLHHQVAQDFRSPFPIKEIWESEASDIFRAAMLGAYTYISEQLHRISQLPHTWREALVTGIICEYPRGLPKIGDLGSKSFASQATGLIEQVLGLDTPGSSFQLAIFLQMDFRKEPLFLQKKFTPAIARMPASLHGWVPEPMLFETEQPLFIWACDPFRASRRQWLVPFQLDALIFCGTDIHSLARTGAGVVQKLIVEHALYHTFLVETLCCMPDDDLAPAVERLYWVEMAGAKFEATTTREPLLTMFRREVALIRSRPEENLLFDLTETVDARFAQIEYMLIHKHATGHLPLPMMGVEYRGHKYLPLLQRNVQEQRCDMCAMLRRRQAAFQYPSRLPRPATRTGSPPNLFQRIRAPDAWRKIMFEGLSSKPKPPPIQRRPYPESVMAKVT